MVMVNSLFQYPAIPAGFEPMAEKSGPIANMLFPLPRFLAVPSGSEIESLYASVAVCDHAAPALRSVEHIMSIAILFIGLCF